MSTRYLIHNIGQKINSNYNTREEILADKTAHYSFDGVYLNVYMNKDILKKLWCPPILFVMGDYVGKDNSFDTGMPYEQYCNWQHLIDLVANYNCKLGWHTWSHRDLTTLSDEDLRIELTPPFAMDYVAYPYGRFDDRVIQAVAAAGFTDAYSVDKGNDSDYQLRRKYLNP